MANNRLVRILGIVIMAILICVTAFASEEAKEGSQLTIPWQEFKALLPLDKDEVVLSMETFQKLLAYTEITVTPAHTLHQGQVVLTKDEFNKFVAGMTPVEKSTTIVPPFDYLITKALYKGKLEKGYMSFTGTFNLQVLKHDKYLKIPLLPLHIALENIIVNGQAPLVVSENGFHHIVLSEKGDFTATVTFSMKTAVEKGMNKIHLPIQQTPITLLSLELPLKDIDIEIPQAQQMLYSVKDDITRVTASIPPNGSISIQWKKQLAPSEKIPPKIYSKVSHLMLIDDDVLKINSEVMYNILHSEIDSVQLQIPKDINILRVYGDGVGEWQEVSKDNQRLIHIPFTYGKKGNTSISILSEKPLSEKSVTNGFTGMRTLNTIRETGFIGIELNTSAEVNIKDTSKLEKIAVQKLPSALYNKSVKPMIHAFRYLKHPFSLALDIKKHQKISVPTATIDSANIVTLFTEDGKVIHRLVYNVRNSSKQFLEVKLPPKADVWSVFVDDKSVESSLNMQGNLLVPLIKSRSQNSLLKDFPIEIIYCLNKNRFSWSGSLTSQLPSIDLLASQLIWSVYLPNDFSYHYFDSSLEKEEIIRGINVFSNNQRRYDEKVMNDLYRARKKNNKELKQEQLGVAYQGKDYQSTFTNIPIQSEEISSQVAAELDFSGRLSGLKQQKVSPTSVYGTGTGTGVMPIQIKIPTGGQVYRFAKTIVRGDDPLNFKVIYSRRQLSKVTTWFIFFILAGALFHIRKKLKNGFNRFYGMVKHHEDTIKACARSKMAPFILLGLMITCYFIWPPLSLALFLLFWISTVYHIFLYRNIKTQQREFSEIGLE